MCASRTFCVRRTVAGVCGGEHSFEGVFTGIRNKYELDTPRKSSDIDDKDYDDDHDDNDDDDDDKYFVINKKTVQ